VPARHGSRSGGPLTSRSEVTRTPNGSGATAKPGQKQSSGLFVPGEGSGHWPDAPCKGSWHQRGQPLHELQRRHHQVRGAVAPEAASTSAKKVSSSPTTRGRQAQRPASRLWPSTADGRALPGHSDSSRPSRAIAARAGIHRCAPTRGSRVAPGMRRSQRCSACSKLAGLGAGATHGRAQTQSAMRGDSADETFGQWWSAFSDSASRCTRKRDMRSAVTGRL